MTMQKKLPVIVDTTLRDGIQMPGLKLALNQKIAVLEQIASTGITEAEIGCPAQGQKAIDEIKELCRHIPDINCSVWCRALRQDIDKALDCGARTIHISFPVSKRHMQIAALSPTEVIDRLVSLLSGIQNHFITVGAQDATRSDIVFMQDFVSAATAAGARRVRIADTVGCATPESAAQLIRNLHACCPGAALEFHGHNDFGLAVATTLSAIQAGVDAVSVTVNGIGERAGNAALEEVLAAAIILYGYESDLRMDNIDNLCSAVAAITQISLSALKPLSGSNAFRHESGIHCHGMLRDNLAYQPFTAGMIGRKTCYSIGPQSGSSSVQAVMSIKKGTLIDRQSSRKLWDRYHERFIHGV